MWKTASAFIGRCAGYLLTGLLLTASLYCIWGWITISDIKSECQRKGLDSTQVLIALQSGPALAYTFSTNGADGQKTSIRIIPRQPAPGRLDRYSPAYNSFSFGAGTNAGFTVQEVAPLNPFLFLSDNVLNILFCFAVGYAVSTVFVLLKYLKRGEVSRRYAFLRPIAGGAVSSCIFVMVLSGGNLIWQQVSSVKGLSVGVIAAIGSVYCEKFEHILTKSLQKGQQDHQPTGQVDAKPEAVRVP